MILNPTLYFHNKYCENLTIQVYNYLETYCKKKKPRVTRFNLFNWFINSLSFTHLFDIGARHRKLRPCEQAVKVVGRIT